MPATALAARLMAAVRMRGLLGRGEVLHSHHRYVLAMGPWGVGVVACQSITRPPAEQWADLVAGWVKVSAVIVAAALVARVAVAAGAEEADPVRCSSARL
jgi:hypothetical protein